MVSLERNLRVKGLMPAMLGVLLAATAFGQTGAVTMAMAPANEYRGMQEREEVFEFAVKPQVQGMMVPGSGFNGSAVRKCVITFATTAACDATVAILDKDQRIIRHLASGVLGKNAPYPFQQDSLAQRLEWDGTDDQGNQVSGFSVQAAGQPAPKPETRNLTPDLSAAVLEKAGPRALKPFSVRVSLGLKAEFDKVMAYDPYLLPPEKDQSSYLVPHHGKMLLARDPDGNFYIVTRSRANVTGQVFGKDGKYIRTFFPPPAAEAEKVMGPLGFKFAATRWGDKVMVSGTYGPCENVGVNPQTPPAGAKTFKDLIEAYPGLVALLKSQPGVGEVMAVPRPKEIPAATVPGGGTVVGLKYLHISADRARDELYAPTGGQVRFLGKTGALDPTWNSDPNGGIGGWECSVGPDGLFYFRWWGRVMTRTDHEGLNVPFSKEYTEHIAGGPGWWERVPPAYKFSGADALNTGNLTRSMTHQCGLHIAPSGLIAVGIQYPNFEWGKKMGVQWDTTRDDASFVVIFDRDGKLLTGNAVGQTRNGTAVTMDREGNVYAIIAGLRPAGQKTYEGCDVPLNAAGGCSGWVKFRSRGGKYPLNVGPGVKVGQGEELPGAVWVYPGVPGAMQGCFCHQNRPDMDFWARSWIPANQMYSVMVLDANMNRIARIGRYGNVDDADPKCGKIHFAWVRAVAVSDVALYAADHGNRRILRAALSYAAEETVGIR